MGCGVEEMMFATTLATIYISYLFWHLGQLGGFATGEVWQQLKLKAKKLNVKLNVIYHLDQRFILRMCKKPCFSSHFPEDRFLKKL
jgi:hypothetical protein